MSDEVVSAGDAVDAIRALIAEAEWIGTADRHVDPLVVRKARAAIDRLVVNAGGRPGHPLRDHWKPDPTPTNPDGDYSLSLRSTEAPLPGGEGAHVWVKSDGCVHIWTEEMDGGTLETLYEHICSLDVAIAKLAEIKAKALAHFGEDWPS